MATRRIGFLIYPDLQALDLVGPMDAFSTANELADAPAPYELVTIGIESGPMRAESGLVFQADHTLEDAPGLDTLIIPGGRGSRIYDRDPRLLAWLRARSATTRRMVCTCTGIYLLAATGLLDGRRATSHWAYAADLRKRYPAIELDVEPLHIHDGPIHSSGGLTAGIDLSLALIEADLGSRAALATARYLVMYMKRPGNQAQFSAPLEAQSRGQGVLATLPARILQHLDEDLPVARIAEWAHMSERNLRRLFKEELGLTPARFLEQLRLDRACTLLVSTRSPLARVAGQVGFSSADAFARAFGRRYGISPGQYRERFA